MLAIFSDIHGNLEALNAVLADINRLGVRELVCLGDVIGYGPDPVECLRIVSTMPVVVAGEWDRALVDHDPSQWSEAINREVERVQRSVAGASDSQALLTAAGSFRDRHNQFGCLFCHGAPGDDSDFLFPEEIYNLRRMDRIAGEFDQAMFCGHTHIPGLFALTSEAKWEYIAVSPGVDYHLGEFSKLICNVGSVGQPRDNDPRAAFVLFDGRVIRFHRVEYDYSVTVAKIKDDPDIDDTQGGRLPEGR